MILISLVVSPCQVDKELATGEFFLRESVKKRKKMEEIKVSAKWIPPVTNGQLILKCLVLIEGFRLQYSEGMCVV